MIADFPQRELAEKMLFSQLEHVASMTQQKQESVSLPPKRENSPSSTQTLQSPLPENKAKPAKLPVKKVIMTNKFRLCNECLILS